MRSILCLLVSMPHVFSFSMGYPGFSQWGSPQSMMPQYGNPMPYGPQPQPAWGNPMGPSSFYYGQQQQPMVQFPGMAPMFPQGNFRGMNMPQQSQMGFSQFSMPSGHRSRGRRGQGGLNMNNLATMQLLESLDLPASLTPMLAADGFMGLSLDSLANAMNPLMGAGGMMQPNMMFPGMGNSAMSPGRPIRKRPGGPGKPKPGSMGLGLVGAKKPTV